jgi:tetratricopeptide (TPR) repeat protein
MAVALVGCIPAAWSASSGQMSTPAPSSFREQTPQDKARDAYNTGDRAAKKADKYADEAEKATDAGKKQKAEKKASQQYTTARRQFEEAVEYAPSMPEAWNSLGYTRRKLGDYDAALEAYDHALSLKPSYAEAIEYRAEAYLRLKRLDDAKQAYLDLFAGNRTLADKLLGSMKSWLDTQRSGGNDPAAVEDFSKWIQERSQIAGQTAALTRDGAAASWR